MLWPTEMTSLITAAPVQRKVQRKSKCTTYLQGPVMRSGSVAEIPICYTVFDHTDRWLHTTKRMLCSTGQTTIDKRGRNADSGKSKLLQETYNLMNTFFLLHLKVEKHIIAQDILTKNIFVRLER